MPRQKTTNIKRNGDRIVVLFTPNVAAYELPYLMLRTFRSDEMTEEKKFACFRDANPANCHISNLFWGDERQDYECRNQIILRSRASQTKEDDPINAVDVPSEIDDIPTGEMKGLVKNTKPLRRLTFMLIDSIKYFMANETMSDETYHYLRMVLIRMTPVKTMDRVPLVNLLSVFDEVPDELPVTTLMSRFKERYNDFILQNM
jgi:hypothetical protein